MAVSQIEEKILGRLAKYAAPSNPLLSASLYQVLGLSILLSRKLHKARRVRRLDITRDTRSLQLYHQIIWLAREGLSITEVYILPYCQDGEQGPECRVMAAKLRASLYHVFCLFHNHPPISTISPRSQETRSSPSSGLTPKGDNGQTTRRSPGKSPRSARESNDRRRRAGSSGLRDPIPSMVSEASYFTNPYSGPAQTPPPPGPPPPIPIEARRTPTRPPGLAPINIPAAQASAAFLLPPLNFIPMTEEHFDTAQHLANSLLPPAHALRLSISLEHAAFLWECEKQYESSVRLAGRAVRTVYTSKEGLDDEEFADASALVQNLAAIVKRGRTEGLRPQPSQETLPSPRQQQPVHHRAPLTIDRTIAVSPTNRGASAQSPNVMSERSSMMRTPERLSTVPEDVSAEATSSSHTLAAALEAPVSRLSSRSGGGGGGAQRKASSSSSTGAFADKAAKRRAVEQAEEVHRRNSAASSREGGDYKSSARQSRLPVPAPLAVSTTSEGYVRRSAPKLSSSSGRKRSRGGGNG
ncbi:hypothetical protein LTR35_017192 [Friedmanniomyces endolithicus]|nr:hypothetical protein LTR35_017192 [Friedmanniomyces endolithicus]KAK0278870.1 hypothetical protein LTS00_013624 [Friedmanniomyces endolithicus]KAK0975304.1 hypothetical protein LTR54_016861 [Friedmanniomyces endolithicus]